MKEKRERTAKQPGEQFFTHMKRASPRMMREILNSDPPIAHEHIKGLVSGWLIQMRMHLSADVIDAITDELIRSPGLSQLKQTQTRLLPDLIARFRGIVDEIERQTSSKINELLSGQPPPGERRSIN